MRFATAAAVVFLTAKLACPAPYQTAAPGEQSAADDSEVSLLRPLEFEPVFRDDFNKDTRDVYQVGGDVALDNGVLTLAEGASVERMIDAGCWTKVRIVLDQSEPDGEGLPSELRVWLRFDGSTDCYVRLRSKVEDERTTCSLALVQIGEQDGKPVHRLVRENQIENVLPTDLSIEYRAGLVRVAFDNTVALASYIENGSARVSGTRIGATTAAWSMSELIVETARMETRKLPTQAPRRFTSDEKEKLVRANKSTARVLALHRQGDYAAAARIGEQVAQVRKSLLGERHPEYASSLNNLAMTYRSLGDYVRAERLLQQTVEIQKLARGERHPDFASSLNNLGALCDSRGDYSRAERLYQQALDIQQLALGEQHPEYANSLTNLAVLYIRMGSYDRAEPLQKQAIEIEETVLGTHHPQYSTSLNNLAGLYYRMGDYARAEPLFKQSLDIEKSLLGEEHPSYAIGLNNLAFLYQTMGDYARAEPLSKRALEIRKAAVGEQHPAFARSLNNLGLLYEKMGDYARAERLCKQARDIYKSALGEQHPDYAASVSNLAGVYRRMEDYGRAEPLYKEALEIEATVHGEQHPEYATSLNNLAALYESMGEFGRAEPLFVQARDIWKSVLGEQHPHHAGSLHNLATLLVCRGDYSRARRLSAESVEIVGANLERNAIVQSERQQKRHQATQRVFLDQHMSISRNTDAATRSLLETLWRWKGAVTFRQRGYRRVAANPKLRPTFDSLQAVSRRLSTLAGRVPIPPRTSSTPAARDAYEQRRTRWEAQFAALAREREDLEQEIATNSVEFRQLREPLSVNTVQGLLPARTAFVDFLDYRDSKPDPERKGQLLFERRYIGFVVRAGRPPVLISLGSVASLNDAITTFRRSLTGSSTGSRAARLAATQLREQLWLPLEQHLDGVETVVISPDTALGTLPFGALPDAEPGKYLIERYRFASLPLAGMLRLLFEEDAKRPSTRGLLVVGDVDYDANDVAQAGEVASRPERMKRPAPRDATSGWASLPGFHNELTIVEREFRRKFRSQGVTTLEDKTATEAAFIREAPRHQNLHLVTHGFFAASKFESYASSREQSRNGRALPSRIGGNKAINQYLPGLLSGVVLAGANNPPPQETPQADGVLTASEIETLDLNAVKLVVLSACETGLGKTAGGEGLTGLQRAFHIAGARTVVASLWKVDDKATQVLMERFYANLWSREKPMSTLDALHEAQVWMLNNPTLSDGTSLRGDPRDRKPAADSDDPAVSAAERADPRYWGAFVLSGDWL